MEHKANMKSDSTAPARLRSFLADQPVALAGASRGWGPPGPGGHERVFHAEILASGEDAAGAALALALARDWMRVSADMENRRKAVLWVQDKAALLLAGRPYHPGLPEDLRKRVIHVAAPTPEDALFALEEGVRCRDLAFVIGEIAGNPRSLDFTASRRLSVAAERHGVPLWLVRLDARRDLSSARMRWAVRSASSVPPCWNGQAPGRPSWRAELFRARAHLPGEWILRDDGRQLVAERAAPAAPDHGDLVPAACA